MGKLRMVKPRLADSMAKTSRVAEVTSYGGERTTRMYGHRWRKERLRFLMQHPLCVDCKAEGITLEATEVDHRVPHRGDEELFWDQNNWQPLCKSHHSKKTASEDNGFGNANR